MRKSRVQWLGRWLIPSLCGYGIILMPGTVFPLSAFWSGILTMIVVHGLFWGGYVVHR